MDVTSAIVGGIVGIVFGILSHWIRTIIDRRTRPALDASIAVLRERALERNNCMENLRDELRQLEHYIGHLYHDPWSEYLEKARKQAMKTREISRKMHGLSDEENDRIIAVINSETDLALSIASLAEEEVSLTPGPKYWVNPSEELQRKVYERTGEDVNEMRMRHQHMYREIMVKLSKQKEYRVTIFSDITRAAPF